MHPLRTDSPDSLAEGGQELRCFDRHESPNQVRLGAVVVMCQDNAESGNALPVDPGIVSLELRGAIRCSFADDLE